ncbi:hypothetical protein Tco_0933502 [Tanacetum coccineum]
MRTRSQARRLRQHQQQQQVPPNLVKPPKDTMADNRTMAELLQAPTEGYEDAIVVPETTNLRNEITNFKQRFDESFSEAWDRFKDLLRACPHHGFSELHMLVKDSAPTPTNSSLQSPTIRNTSQDVDEIPQQQHEQHQDNQALLQPKIVADNVPNAMFDGDVFENPFALPSSSAAEYHLHNMWIHQTCIRFINRTNMIINGLRIIPWNK